MTHTKALFLTAVILLAGVPSAVAAQQTDDVTLTVTVVDTDGNTISGATVEATWDGGSATDTTRANGQALIDVPRGSTVAIDVANQEYIRNTDYVVENATEQSVNVSVAKKGTATVTVTGTQGEPISNAWVRLWQDRTRIVSERTNESGIHRTKPIEQGQYQLYVFKEGYLRNRTTLQVTGNVSDSLSIEQGSVTVTFRVTDDHFDPPAPVQNATLDVTGVAQGVKTLGNGESTLSVPVNDAYDVSVTKPGYQAVDRRLGVREAATSMNLTIQRTPAISIDSLADRVVVGENVSIHVSDEYETPVENATITLDGESVGQTDATGALIFRVEGPGTHTVRATADGLETTATIQAGELATESPATSTTTDETTSTATETSTGFGPGFSPVVALLGVLLAVALLSRR